MKEKQKTKKEKCTNNLEKTAALVTAPIIQAAGKR